ncbi:EAL domain, c-di-GMP-specific phosphodiesterase class I (or its enzymatically inactive variant) [Loktanella fryxellensis]|uniref:EAL domain, c-di-GMP-specific phosphodiesterase class I (Or its enzymatically inactive variant) n=1 Tax=Loktanella fryxellensis TaxID=245187 RepID=A0A1H8FQW4_9RHOB|nr:EAL domain-containing protein [Loktanella fryxellensis]SEN33980.1 EAL domain, c-di-GMP-specific phosphodiesterase class I (or its enzymatically inactive variant) [Loktanella fryxellensis]
MPQSHVSALPDGEQDYADPLQFAFASRDADTPTLVTRALDAGRAQLAFQPIVLTATPGKVAFYEGLIRLLDDAGRVIPAANFMPQVADSAIGRRIDTLALQLALRMLRLHQGMRLSINVSARSLADWRWRRTLEAGLVEHGALGQRLIFEISETSAMHLHEVVMGFMEDMQPRGVAFALDGFGGGMTAFRHLKDFFFDMVKIDKSFVKGIAGDPDNQVLVEALVTVAHQFEMFAVAEGVENARDAAWLQGIAVDCLQGYHFGAPKFEIDER